MPQSRSIAERAIRSARGLALAGLLTVLCARPGAWADRRSPAAAAQPEYHLYIPLFERPQVHFTLFVPLFVRPRAAMATARLGAGAPRGSAFVQRVGEDLELDGRPYRFVGTNAVYLAGPFFPETHAEEIVSFLASHGVQVIRVWVEPWCDLQRVARLVDLAGQYNVRLILTLQDFFGHTDGWWFKAKYEEIDLPHIRNIVPRFANRPEVLMWELMNEPTCPYEDNNPACWEAFVHWAEVTSAEIKRLDPNHLVSVGTQHAGFDPAAAEAFRRVHALGTIDIVSVHYGVGDVPQKELDIAHELGKPVYLGETYLQAYDSNCRPLAEGILEARAQRIAIDIERSRRLGIDGYLLWQYLHEGCGALDYFASDPVWQVMAAQRE